MIGTCLHSKIGVTTTATLLRYCVRQYTSQKFGRYLECGGTTPLFFVLFVPSQFNILEYFDAYGCILTIGCFDVSELTRTIFCLPRGILNARK